MRLGDELARLAHQRQLARRFEFRTFLKYRA
jgi:hypothetical protein